MNTAELIICAAAALRGFNGIYRELMKHAMAKSLHMAVGDQYRWN